MQRRGSNFYKTQLAFRAELFEEGDVVRHSHTNEGIIGIVNKISSKENKIYVAWNHGLITQQDPDDITLVMYVDDKMRERLKRSLIASGSNAKKMGTRRMSGKTEDPYEFYSGNPDIHGIDEPVSGGTDVMQRLVRKLHKESIKEQGIVEASEKTGEVDGMSCRRAMYHKGMGRLYTMTRTEKANGMCNCPRCKCQDMKSEVFSRGIKIFICPNCGWKITTDKVV